MQAENLVAIREYCVIQELEPSFVMALGDAGLLEIIVIDETSYFHEQQLTELERMVRLHQDLKINLEGIEAISHLIEKMKKMQDELIVLKNKLRKYEHVDE